MKLATNDRVGNECEFTGEDFYLIFKLQSENSDTATIGLVGHGRPCRSRR